MDNTFRFKEARDRGCIFLLRHQGIMGEFPEDQPVLDNYYKTLTAFQACGHNVAAHRLCQWIRTKGMTTEGDFGPKQEAAAGYALAYFNAWVILGAHRLGQFDISFRGIDFILRFQDNQTGGFYSHPTQQNPETKQDLMVVSMCGLACLSTGNTQAALRAGDWLKTIMAAQPDFPNRLYTAYTRAQGLHIDHNPQEAFRFVVVADSKEDQAFFNPGIAAGFLCRLFQATKDKEWLQLAIEYMRFAEVASDELFLLIRAGKVGWAASLLFTVTGDEKYRAMAIRIGHNLVDLQSKQGYWSAVGKQIPNYDSTAERVIWMDEITQVSDGINTRIS